MSERGSRTRADKLELEARLLTAEELLVSGLSPARVQRELARKYGISTRQVRTYVAKIVERWEKESKEDAAHRREKLFRMAERLYAKAYAQDRLGPANAALQTLAKLGGAFAKGQSDREEMVKALGPPPTGNPTKALLWAQDVLLLSLQDIATDPSIEPERRWRLLADLAAKIGFTHSRTLLQDEINTVKQRVLGSSAEASRPQALADIPRPSTARRAR
jgi:hypothetical protein